MPTRFTSSAIKNPVAALHFAASIPAVESVVVSAALLPAACVDAAAPTAVVSLSLTASHFSSKLGCCCADCYVHISLSCVITIITLSVSLYPPSTFPQWSLENEKLNLKSHNGVQGKQK